MAQNFFLKEPSPTKVLVVNEKGETVKVDVENLPLVESGGSQYILVRLGGGVTVQALRPQSSYFNVALDNILLLQSDGGFAVIPLNTTLTNMTGSNLSSMLASYKTAYATLVSGVTAATLHYSKMTSAGAVTSEVYNLKD